MLHILVKFVVGLCLMVGMLVLWMVGGMAWMSLWVNRMVILMVGMLAYLLLMAS